MCIGRRQSCNQWGSNGYIEFTRSRVDCGGDILKPTHYLPVCWFVWSRANIVSASDTGPGPVREAAASVETFFRLVWDATGSYQAFSGREATKGQKSG